MVKKKIHFIVCFWHIIIVQKDMQNIAVMICTQLYLYLQHAHLPLQKALEQRG